ncbi:MAG: 50S ribosomal protein L10 [Bryobacterales bacterium]|nr:50S ribosomal protein L10 [Bryobacterales bacterium]MDE0264484.1 50S ribosomal protein L10 [Bryobacterales bacterium]MDE0622409.1 50S ribosomal protein L10 [Bryobacterales bacterium]
MKSKAQKRQILEELQHGFAEEPAIIVCKFEGLTVAEDQALRGVIRDLGGSYRVVANRLALLAARGTPYEEALTGQSGMTALAFLGKDPVSTLKALVAFSKEQDKFSFNCGVVDCRTVDLDQLTELSKLPDKAGLQVRILYMLNSSAQRLMGVLNAPARDIAAVLQQAVEKKKFNG